MKLSFSSREYAHWGFVNVSPTAPAPEVLLDGEWYQLEWWNDVTSDQHRTLSRSLKLRASDVTKGTARIARLLVAGPGAQENPNATVVLDVGRHLATVRVSDDPETVFRSTGAIDVA